MFLDDTTPTCHTKNTSETYVEALLKSQILQWKELRMLRKNGKQIKSKCH